MYVTGKLKETEKTIAESQQDLKESSYLNQKLQEELLKRNTQLATMDAKLKSLIETM